MERLNMCYGWELSAFKSEQIFGEQIFGEQNIWYGWALWACQSE